MPDPDVQPGPVSGSPTSPPRAANADSTPRETPSDLDTLADLLDEALYATPEAREALLARVAARNPAQADELRALIESLPDPEIVSDGHPSGLAPTSTSTSTSTSTPSSMPTPHAPFVPGGMATPSTDALDSDEAFVGEPAIGETIGGCVLEAVLGRGGAGTVYAARQLEPPRPVAVKVLRIAHARLSHIRRFQTEALALARLEHPSIVRIYASGVARREGVDLPYIVMERVESGEDFVAWARKAGRAHREIAARLADVCDGMQHGHSRALMHRDLKPSNVLVSADGRPHIIDFGIARILGDDAMRAEETFAGALIGTPAYMAPEQFELASSELDARVDVHALGTILYESLTGRRPYAISRQLAYDAARIMRESTPVSVDRIDAAIPRDLAAIVAKATARERERRYATAAEFAEDLRAFVDGRAVRARPESTHERALRWMRRNPTSTAAIVVTTIALVAATVFSAVQWQPSRHQLMLASLARAATASSELDLGGAVARIAEAREVADGKIPPFVFGMLEAPFDTAMQAYDAAAKGHRLAGALSPDRRRWIASGDGDDVQIVDLVTGVLSRAQVPSNPQYVWGCGFTPDGARTFVGSNDGIYEILPDGRCELRLAMRVGAFRGFVPTARGEAGFYFLANGNRVARYVPDGASKSPVSELPPGARIGSMAGHGDRLYVAGGNERLYAFDIDADGGLSRDASFAPPRATGGSVAVSSDGMLLARGLGDGRVLLLDAQTGAELGEHYARHPVISLAFTPSNEHLFVGDRGGRVHRVRVHREEGRVRIEPLAIQRTQSGDPVWAVGAIDETQVMANIGYSVVRLDFGPSWSATPDPFPGKLVRAASAFDGRAMRALSANGRVYELDLAHGAWTLLPHGELGLEPVERGAITAAGDAVAAWDGSSVLIRDLRSGETRVIDAPSSNDTAALAWSADGARLFLALPDRLVVLDRRGEILASGFMAMGFVSSIASFASSDGSEDRVVVRFASDVERVAEFEISGSSVVALPDSIPLTDVRRVGDRFVMAELGGPIRVYANGGFEALRDGPSVRLHGHSDIVSSIELSPDGQWLASGGRDGTVRVWSLRLAECFLPLYGPGGRVMFVRWSSDGQSLLAIDQFGAVRLYDSVPRRVRLGVAPD